MARESISSTRVTSWSSNAGAVVSFVIQEIANRELRVAS